MTVTRTVQVKLNVPTDAEPALSETVSQFRYCANQTSDWAWDESDTCVTNKRTAEQALYDRLRAETDLHSNIVQKAIGRAITAVKSGVARRKQGQSTSCPQFTAESVVYDKRAATFYRDHVSLSTIDGRVECDYILPDDLDTPHHRYLLNEEYEFRTSTLQQRDEEWYLYATMQSIESNSESDTGHRTVLGVDLGVSNIAVTSTGSFWSGDEFNHWRREYERRRASFQQHGTRWARMNIQSVGHKATGRFTQSLHRVVNEILDEAQEYDCSFIAVEDLTHIRKRLSHASWQHRWAFRRLSQYLEYKANAHGIEVVRVAPDDTSRRCSTCGHVASENRRDATFECCRCGYENHADYNAAKNIGYRALQQIQTGSAGGAPAGVRLNSGILTQDGITACSGSDRSR